ncbi:glycerophosphodiester phosphodiesterase [Chengkuizengella axinellae]|uniref:Glycerophosphodiester phosphodiesterase n=1 Tax=Chengkuizengella axinellae TaxID=3064388 RepID=A0ABT9IYT0_9BACL|nr:glycerophosphodiester phosphodiesterase [Chengkuizengella sp. 2205SS18-9]MDP5273959.1 glycerophosphodiester phosphodiesterase [Chengkuizengella sp. 2205SS18-9]
MESQIESKKSKKRIKKMKWLFSILSVIGCLFIIFQFIPVKKQEKNVFISDGSPLVIAHRGGADIMPENTLTAFEHSRQMGVDALEFDVHLSKDGKIVVMHDETLDRTTDGTGFIANYTLDELKKLDAGYHFKDEQGNFAFRGKGVTIPTLKEVFDGFSDLPMVIEIKPENKELTEKVYEMIKEYNLESQVIINSFYETVLTWFYELAGDEIPIGAGPDTVKKYVISNKLYLDRLIPLNVSAFQLPMEDSGINLTTKRIIQSLQDRNIVVQYWTINEVTDMEKLIDLGVDGIITNKPDLLLEVLNRS